MMARSKPYYSFLQKWDPSIHEETFYDPAAQPWTTAIETHTALIYREVEAYLGSNAGILKPFYSTQMVSAPGKWKSFNFSFWGMETSREACEACPETIRLLRQVPGILAASISVLEPQAEIKAHRGDTDAIYRCHLGLVIPAALPACGFQVGEEARSWEQGKLLVFNDANIHKAWNHTDEKRIVMIIDVIRPEYASQKRRVCARVYGSIIFQALNAKYKVFKKKKGLLVRFIYWANSVYVLAGFLTINRRRLWL